MPHIALAHPTESSFEVRIRRVLWVLLAGMLIVAASGVLSAWALSNAASDVDRLERSMVALGGILEGMVDQESGVRGFLITQREPFLETYGPGGATADANRVLLEELVGELDGFEVFDDLDRAIADWRGVADQEIRLVRDARGDEAIAIAESGAAKERFDLIRTYVRDIDGRLGDIADARNQRQADLEKLLAVVGLAVALGALIVIVATLRWLQQSVTLPLAALTGAVSDPDERAFSALTDNAAGEVAAVARSADRMRRAADLERNEAVLVAEQTERKRIAADLHDGPVQMLFAVQLRLQQLLNHHHNDPDVVEVVGSGIEVLEATQSDLRILMFDLAPPGLGEKSLADVVSATVPQVLEPPARSVIDVPDDVTFDTTSQLVACRVIVEAIRNVNRHANATTVTVRVRSAGHIVTVEVIDDGEGFDASGAAPVGHFGLDIMRSLVESVGGRFDVRSAPGAGTAVHAMLPVASLSDQ